MSKSAGKSESAMASASARPAQAAGWYVYGIVPADVRPPRKRTVGDGHHRSTLIRYRDIAALTSPVELGVPLGTPDDLIAHQRMLDAVAARAAVLPLRFGAVLAEGDDVRKVLLADHHAEFAEALGKFAGTVQFVVAGRYSEDAVLTEIVREHGEVAELAAAIRGKDELATRDLRIRLGEAVNSAITGKRDADTARFAAQVEPYCEAITAREPSHEQDAVCLALLVRRGQEDELRQQVGEVADQWRDRENIRLLGPMAPYDFVVAAAPG